MTPLDYDAALASSGAFEISVKEGEEDTFTRVLATDSMILSKCFPAGGGAAVQTTGGQGSSAASRRLIEAFSVAIQEARASSRASMIAELAASIAHVALHSDAAAIAHTVEWGFALDIATAPAVAGALANAFNLVGPGAFVVCGHCDSPDEVATASSQAPKANTSYISWPNMLWLCTVIHAACIVDDHGCFLESNARDATFQRTELLQIGGFVPSNICGEKMRR
jgi:hypothetical protein